MRTFVAALGLVLAVSSPTWGQAQPVQDSLFELVVPGGLRTLRTLGLAPEERGVVIPLMARAIYGHQRTLLDQVRINADLAAALAPPAGAVDGEPPVTIPAPLTARVWERLLPPPPNKTSIDLFARVMRDRSALLLMAALTATDRSIRALVTDDGGLLRWIYAEAAGTFLVVSGSLRLEAGHVVVPGGADAAAIWTHLVGVSPAKPAAFIRALLTKDRGRLAWYLDTMAKLDDQRLAAAWGSSRLDGAAGLYASFRESDPQWLIEMQPYRRSAADAWMVLNLIDFQIGVAGPAWEWLWTALFNNVELTREAARRISTGPALRVSLSWLTRNIVMQPSRERRDRFEMFRFAQRAFSSVKLANQDDATNLLVTLGGYRKYRGVLLSLERMNVASLATWAAMVEASRYVDERGSGDRGFALESFQSAIAIVERLRHLRAIDVPATERLLLALSDHALGHSEVPHGVACWLIEVLLPSLPPPSRPDKWIGATAYESTVLQALAGVSPPTPQTVDWEGLTYELDYAAAERDRLLAVRERLSSPGLDAAIASNDSEQIATALKTIVYAIALGDPEGPAVLSGDAPSRHDFGLHSTALMREVWSWAPPEERHGDGRPWRAQGGLMSLDLAFARLALGRVGEYEMPREPTLTLNDFSVFARTARILVPAELTDDDRDGIAAAIDRGRQRVARAGTDPAAVMALAAEARFPSSLRQVLPWILAHQPEAIPGLFGLRDQLWLGKPTVPPDRLDRWGMYAGGIDGSHTTTMARSAPWEDFTGRGDLGQIATQVPDLTLRLVQETARRKLPAALVPALLAFAVQDYWHDVRARFGDDWPQMSKQAAALSADRVEDYVAGLTGRGPLKRPN